MSIKNLRYYLSLTEVKDTDVVNLEAAPFVKFYIDGVKAYEDEFYDEAAEKFEKSLKSYLKSEEECRIYCEGPFDQGWLPEFTSSVASMVYFILLPNFFHITEIIKKKKFFFLNFQITLLTV